MYKKQFIILKPVRNIVILELILFVFWSKLEHEQLPAREIESVGQFVR